MLKVFALRYHQSNQLKTSISVEKQSFEIIAPDFTFTENDYVVCIRDLHLFSE